MLPVYGVSGLISNRSPPRPLLDHLGKLLRVARPGEIGDQYGGGRINTALLCELATHKNFVKLLSDIEIYVNGTAT